MSEFDKINTDADLDREFRKVDKIKIVRKYPIIEQLSEVCPDEAVTEQIIKLIAILEMMDDAHTERISTLENSAKSWQIAAYSWEHVAEKAMAFIEKHMPGYPKR